MTSSQEDRDAVAVTVDLSPYVRTDNEAKVKRLTSIGLDSTDSSAAKWAGQSYENGTPNGEEAIESLDNGKVTVQGSEGVLVSF